MTLQEKIQSDMKEAMRSQNASFLSVVRMLIAAIQSKQIEKRAKAGDQTVVLTDDEVTAVLRSEAKKRNDAIIELDKAGRAELSAKEKSELTMIQAYLPKEMEDEELEAIVSDVFAKAGAITEKEFGKVMGLAMKETKGRASGDRVSALIKKLMQK
jgi:uncharacterized protein YqeY